MRMFSTVFGGVAASVMIATMALAAETPPPPPPVPNSDPMQQTVCRKQLETGSLVRSKKTCHTKAQWAYIDDANQSFGRKMVEDGLGGTNGRQ